MDKNLKSGDLDINITLKNSEAILYLNYIEKSGYNLIGALLDTKNNQIRNLETELYRMHKKYSELTSEYAAEKDLNNDIKSHLENITEVSSLNSYFYKASKRKPPVKSLSSFLEMVTAAIDTYYSNVYKSSFTKSSKPTFHEFIEYTKD